MKKFATILDLIKEGQFPQVATAAGRMQASQKAMGKFKQQLGTGNMFQQQKPVAATNPAVQSPPGAANIKPGGIKPGFAAKQYNPFGKQTAKGLGIPDSNPFK